MFCTNCGNRLDDDDVFCTSCGSKTKNIQNESMNQSAVTGNYANTAFNMNQRNSDGNLEGNKAQQIESPIKKETLDAFAKKAGDVVSEIKTKQGENPMNKFSLIAGGLIILIILRLLFSGWLFGSSITVFTFIRRFIMIAGYAMAAFALITSRRDNVLTIGFGICAAISVLNVFVTIFSWGVLSFTTIYGLIALVYSIVTVLSWAGAAFITLVSNTDIMKEGKTIARQLWFVPAAILAAATLVHSPVNGTYLTLLSDFARAAAIGLAMFWVVFPDGMPKKEKAAEPVNRSNEWGMAGNMNNVNTVNNSMYNTNPALDDTMYCGMAKHILLLLLTCGIWQLVWIYKMSDFTNVVTDEEQWNPAVKLLLCIFLPFYFIYWTYKAAQRIDKIAASCGMMSDLATICLILSIFIPIVPPILMQDKVNNILVLKNNNRNA